MPGVSAYLIGLYLESIHVGVSHRSTYTLVLLLLIILTCFFSAILRVNINLRCDVLALLIRKTLTASIYDKMLKLRIQEVSEASPGKLITLASGDMALIEQGSIQIQYLIAGPLSSILQLIVPFNLVRLMV